MKNTKILLIAALLGTVLAGCQNDIEIQNPEEKPIEGQGWTLTVNATLGPNTKAMSLNGTELKSYWKEGEVVGVFLGGTKLGTLTAGNITNGGANAVLSGVLDTVDGVELQSGITLVFPDMDELTFNYQGQDGSAPSESGTMATNYDYALASVGLSAIDTNTKKLTAGDNAAFASQQSIYRLRFKESSSYFQVNSIVLSASSGQIVRSRALESNLWTSHCGTLTMTPTVTPSDNFYYMAVRNDNISADDVYTFSVVRKSDNALLEGTKTILAAALASPTYIPTSVAVSQKIMAPQSTTIDSEAEVL